MTTNDAIRAEASVPRAAWDRFVSNSSNALIFHRAGWLEVLQETQAATAKQYGLFRGPEGDRMVGVIPLLVKRFGPFRVAGSPLIVEDTPYMGPAVGDELLAESLLAVRDAVRKDVAFLRLLLPYTSSLSAADRRVLHDQGFEVTEKHTHVLDLSMGTSSIWDRMEGRCRTAVRRARKGGVELQRVEDGDRESILRYYQLVEDVYRRQGRETPNSFDFYDGLWRRFGGGDVLSLTLARVDGRDVAGALFGHDQDRVYYLDGASDREHRKLNATNLILWDAVEWAAATGRSEFDFVGSDIPRLARFKASFGGELVTYLCVEWARSRVVRGMRDWYGQRGKSIIGKFRRAFRRLSSL